MSTTYQPTMTLAQWVREYQAATGQSIEGAAERLDLSRPFLAQLLGGTRKPGHDTLEKIKLRTGGRVTADSWQ